MRIYNIVLAVIKQGNCYVMQKRSNHPKVGAAGLIGFYGGKVEENENPAIALSRELAEETTLEVRADNLKPIGNVSIEMDHVNGRAKVNAQAFSLEVPQNKDITSKEWEMVTIKIELVKNRVDELTPATKAIFKEILWR